MKKSKWLLIITFFVSIISLIVCIIAYTTDCSKIVYDIAMAMFGSSILGFIMSLIEYFAVKRAAMEVFYQEAFKAIQKLGKARYFLTDYPVELIKNCIEEEWKNHFGEQFGQQPQYECKEQLITLIKNRTYPETLNDSNLYENEYKKIMDKTYIELGECFDSYIDISTMNLGELHNAYGNLDFIFLNKKLRINVAFYKILYPIRELSKSAINNAYHFKMCKDKTGNISACTSLILELNKQWFSTKEKDSEHAYEITVYRKKYNDLSNELEEFRCMIYKQTFEPINFNYIHYARHQKIRDDE